MQILSGTYRHTPLQSPRDPRVHPMGSREKLALFNSLKSLLPTPSLTGLSVLDAFAGSGALGLEALSLGATSVTFVEKSPKIARILQENLKNVIKDQLLIKNSTTVLLGAVEAISVDQSFDIIFADPPYDLYNDAMIAPLTRLLNKSAILCLSLPSDAPTPSYEALTLISRKNYARASIIFFQNCK